jgi:lipopolysaccharide/colanic/teichoic acid biosynthesis glycosyltransferase
MNNGQSAFPVWKRVIDIVVAGTSLVVLSPFLVLVAFLIKVTSPGPALFSQKRIGYQGKPFSMWKFRTMRPDVDTTSHQAHFASLIDTDAPMVKLDAKNDPRVFPLGRMLRRCCVDELPQLFNVLRGEMSLVGPRPCMPYEAEQYKPWQRSRFNAVPGMTGLWQVSGKNRTTFTEMIQMDIEYANRVSLPLDLKILIKTVPSIFTTPAVRKGA